MADNSTKSVQICSACHRQSSKLLLCGQCNLAYFCNAACQRQIWKAHKPVCVAIANPAVEMRKTQRCGNGLFATKAFRRGDLIIMEKVQYLTMKDLAGRGRLTQFGYTLTEENGSEGLASHGPILSILNHACIPNAWVKREAGPYRKLYARRDIQSGEEICTFYDGADSADEECGSTESRAAKRASLKDRFGLDCLCSHCEMDVVLGEDGAMDMD
ncbi:hypothetical protein H257_08578 [Aphanomyces astaci]|uniref:MYND-type domain-containing protein n=1 Tax=Aphanomyces astaci TaxID=112090 RepID=W4GF80_APHAT|nr:hypothetical protein H257_08578 [Aphanomyces astaci]ETV77714.1 hypothetical protein H257_08578 [Aphanomyces astaci]KAF0776200.1 hypothetical protein AaE_000099 [Aphanomyces astaci]RHY06438.1 hypothetical protein DYB36_006403 [Aphanomyces astaci]RHY10716.1 hypothetical protein DYB25_006055 [Aphanomyces astaci]RHY36892.1 hypothetical protein DYB34_010796 [Aphanomyces astaci]|eukprot:XP_009832824.1 hypothetical protein H257_08578 [Aphanomyces astaci]